MGISRKIAAIILICTSLNANAQFDYMRSGIGMHRQILNLTFNADSATSEFKPWIIGYSAIVQSMINANPDLLASTDFSALIKELKEHETDNDFYHLCLADLYLMRSFASFSNNYKLTAASSYMLALQNINKTSGWKRNRYGMLQLVLDAQLYNTFPSLAKNLTPQQRIEEFCQMQRDIENDPTAPATLKTESALLAILLLPSLGDDGTTLQDIYRNSTYIETSNAATVLVAAQALMHHGHSAEAAKLLNKSLHNGHFDKCNMFNLLMGNTLLNLLNDSCQIYLSQYINQQANNADVEYAKLKLAWHSFLKGDTLKTKQLCNEIKHSPASTSNDRQAQYECSLLSHWDTTLLRARLLFDAGNYADCEQLLLINRDDIKSYSAVQLNEYAYRMGRVCHKNGQTELAKHFYSISANPNLADKVYYPCYSLYYLGVISQAEGDTEAARNYFKQCQKTNSPIYKESIHRKAKIASDGL